MNAFTRRVLVFLATYALVSGVRVPGLRLDRTGGALVGAVLMVLVFMGLTALYLDIFNPVKP